MRGLFSQDASVALKFHLQREKNPEKFNSRCVSRLASVCWRPSAGGEGPNSDICRTFMGISGLRPLARLVVATCLLLSPRMN